MADTFDQNKWIDKRKLRRQATPGKMIMDTLLQLQANEPSRAVAIDAFKDIPLSVETIAFTIVNMMDGGYVKITEDQRYYFDLNEYKKFEKVTLAKAYSVFLIPILLFLLFFMLLGGTFSLFN